MIFLSHKLSRKTVWFSLYSGGRRSQPFNSCFCISVSLGYIVLFQALYEQILADGLSVRNVEEIVRGGVDAAALEQAGKEKPAQRKPKLPEEFNLLKDHLSSFFNTKVQLVCNEKGKGKITIPFASEDELEKLIGLLDKLK